MRLALPIIILSFFNVILCQQAEYLDLRGYENLLQSSRKANQEIMCSTLDDFETGVIHFKNQMHTDPVEINFDLISDQFYVRLEGEYFTIPKMAVDSVIFEKTTREGSMQLLLIKPKGFIEVAELLHDGIYKLYRTFDAKITSKNYNAILDVGTNTYSYKKNATYWLEDHEGQLYKMPKKLKHFKKSNLPAKLINFTKKYSKKYSYRKGTSIIEFLYLFEADK